MRVTKGTVVSKLFLWLFGWIFEPLFSFFVFCLNYGFSETFGRGVNSNQANKPRLFVAWYLVTV